MKFYNPFKWHIVKDKNNNYWVRSLSIIGWRWLDEENYSWLLQEGAPSFRTLQEARDMLKKVKERNKELQYEVVE